MSILYFCYESQAQISAEELYTWHNRPGALERLIPPWQGMKVISSKGTLEEGNEVVCDLWIGPLKQRSLFKHGISIEGRSFSAHQVIGPFSCWEHRHLFIPQGAEKCFLKDEIYYTLPLGSLGLFIGNHYVSSKLQKIFQYRHRVAKGDCSFHRRYSKGRPMKIAIAGASGLLGSALIPFLTTGGHTVITLSRTQKEGSIFWNPYAGELDAASLEDFDAIINLSGENIGSGRWTKAKKERILLSRVMATKTLCNALLRMKNPPKILLNASACGFYGNRNDEELTEQSTLGEGFLANVCRQWEEPLRTLKGKGIRTVALRFGAILSPKGGALDKMLWPFKCCLGGKIGSGQQYMSWIAIDDVLGAILHILATDSLDGPVNITAPTPLTNAEFTETLGKALNRPTFMVMPATVAKVIFGEMADDLLLSSCRALPKRLQETGYEFFYPKLSHALDHLL